MFLCIETSQPTICPPLSSLLLNFPLRKKPHQTHTHPSHTERHRKSSPTNPTKHKNVETSRNQFFIHSFIYSYMHIFIAPFHHPTIHPIHHPSIHSTIQFFHSQTIKSPLQTYHPTITKASERRRREKQRHDDQNIRTGPRTNLCRKTDRQDKQVKKCKK